MTEQTKETTNDKKLTFWLHENGALGTTHHGYDPGPKYHKITRDEYKAISDQRSGTTVDAPTHDSVNHPTHYTAHPSGIECIDITEHMNYNTGNAVKYLWRAGLKGDAVQDLRKAEFYVAREITRLEKARRDD